MATITDTEEIICNFSRSHIIQSESSEVLTVLVTFIAEGRFSVNVSNRKCFVFSSRVPAPDLSVFYKEISTELDKNIQLET